MDEIALLPFVISIPAFVVIGYTIVDALRRSDLSGGRKVMWVAVAIVLPVVGSFLYLLSRPFRDPVHTGIRGNDRTTEFVELLIRREAGDVDDAEFSAAKQALFADAGTGD